MNWVINGLIDGTLGLAKGALGLEAAFDFVATDGGAAGNAIGVRLTW